MPSKVTIGDPVVFIFKPWSGQNVLRIGTVLKTFESGSIKVGYTTSQGDKDDRLVKAHRWMTKEKINASV